MLKDAVAKWEEGNWTPILHDGDFEFNSRTSQDLRGKWRNMKNAGQVP